MKLSADVDRTEYTMTLTDHEVQLLILSLSWAVERSEQYQGAQTKPLKAIEASLRHEFHRFGSFEELSATILDDGISRDWLKSYVRNMKRQSTRRLQADRGQQSEE